MIWVRRQRWRVAGAALEAVAADDVALGGHQVADGEQARRLGLARPARTISPANSCPMTTGGLSRLLAQRVPFPDVQVGAADAGVVDPDEHVARAAGGHGDVPHLHAGAGCGFDESAHAGIGDRERENGHPERV